MWAYFWVSRLHLTAAIPCYGGKFAFLFYVCAVHAWLTRREWNCRLKVNVHALMYVHACLCIKKGLQVPLWWYLDPSFVWNPASLSQSVASWKRLGVPIWTWCVFWRCREAQRVKTLMKALVLIPADIHEQPNLELSWWLANKLQGHNNTTQSYRAANLPWWKCSNKTVNNKLASSVVLRKIKTVMRHISLWRMTECTEVICSSIMPFVFNLSWTYWFQMWLKMSSCPTMTLVISWSNNSEWQSHSWFSSHLPSAANVTLQIILRKMA